MTTSTDKSYFDLHITGLGYLNEPHRDSRRPVGLSQTGMV